MDDVRSILLRTWGEVEPVIAQIMSLLVDPDNQDARELWDKLVEVTDVSEEDRALAREYLSEAFIDLHSCRLLYRKKIYSRATYCLQQAVEKAVKSWALGLGFLNRDGVRSSGHRTPMIFLTMLSQTQLRPLIEVIGQYAPEMNTDITSAERVIGRGTHTDTARMPEERIESYLKSMESLDLIVDAVDELVIQFAEARGQVGTSPVGQRFAVGMSLLFLGLITFPHEAFTRYPDGDTASGELVPKEYDRSLGIVKSITKLEKCLASRMELLSSLLNGDTVPRHGFRRFCHWPGR